MMLTLILFWITLTFFVFSFKKQKLIISKQLPGPRGLPAVGNVLQLLTKRPYLKLSKWAEEFGGFYSLRLAKIRLLVINDVDVMKDLLGRMAATGRYQSELLTMTTWNGSYGLLTTEGKAWQEQKQFAFRTLRKLGFGQLSRMEPMILEEIDEVCTLIDKEQLAYGRVVLKETFQLAAGNALWTIITGKRTELRRSKFVHLANKWLAHISIGAQTGLGFFPWLKYIAPVKSGFQGFKEVCEEIHEYVEQYFEGHRGISRRNGDPQRDIVEAYVEKVEGCQDPQSTFFGEMGWKHSYASVFQLMISGVASMGSVLNWLFFYLSLNADEQRKLQQEIDMVIGRNRSPCFADKARMPFIEAVILETLRFASQNTIGGVVKLLEDVTFRGYNLPKGMILVSNLYHVLQDKAIWGDPQNFRPSRFLEKGGEKLKDYVVAFQVGKRSCPGKWFAKDILFMFVARLFQRYTFSLDPSIENVSDYLEPVPGLLRRSKMMPLIVSKRT